MRDVGRAVREVRDLGWAGLGWAGVSVGLWCAGQWHGLEVVSRNGPKLNRTEFDV